MDLDGTLADFELGYKQVFGVEVRHDAERPDWKKIRNTPDFFLNLPPMPDMQELWDVIKRWTPIVLTGIPPAERRVTEAADNKIAWVRKHLGDRVEVRCCRASEKYTHCSPGDVLIDDWPKYKDLWVGAGGIWITHRSAKETIDELTTIFL